MKIQEIVKILTDSGIEANEANIEVKLLIERFAGFGIKDIILGNKIDDERLKVVKEKAELRAKTRCPIQHIIGYAYFMGENYIVNENVLIPRDETEILVRKAIEIINKKNLKLVLDIGTGSGCIACAIAQNTEVKVLGVDISSDALNIALENASRLNLYNKAIFRKSDIFSNVHDDEKFDMIISNPPYIPKSQKNALQKEVLYDPDIALFTEDLDGLEYYQRIAKDASKYLNHNGYLLFESGLNQADNIKDIMQTEGFINVGIVQDLAGIDRVVYGHKE